MEKQSWKTLAIIFMVLFILETAGFIWITSIGLEMVELENECAYNVCADYESYAYDDIEEVCYCYNNNEIEHQEFIG